MNAFRKRSDIIAEEIKRWIVDRNMVAGQKLPSEAALAELFRVGKSSVREGLRSLEVQGLVRTSAGQTGGSFIVAVPDDRASSLLQNYFYFKKLTPGQIYELRQAIEPKLAAHLAVNGDEHAIRTMRSQIDICRPVSNDPHELAVQMQASVEFHDVMARHAKNPLLCFHCRFLNQLVVKLVKSRTSSDPGGIARANLAAHEAILDAIVARDPNRAERRMSDHITEIQSYYPAMRLENGFLEESPVSIPIPPMSPNTKRQTGE